MNHDCRGENIKMKKSLCILYARCRTLCLQYIMQNGVYLEHPSALDLDYTYGRKITKKQLKYLRKLFKADFEKHLTCTRLEFGALLMLDKSLCYNYCFKRKLKNYMFDDWWCNVCSLVRCELDYLGNSKWKVIFYGNGY